MIKPNFFIVGAAKAGTTSLWEAFRQHPQIFMIGDDLSTKEPSFFVDGYGVRSLGEYRDFFSNASAYKIVGDASAAYLSSLDVANKIHSYNPEAKILICLRNPVDRAYSLYCWMVQQGYEWIPTFENAIAREEVRRWRVIPNFFERQFKDDYMYFSSGCYFNQVSQYLKYFGSNVKVIFFEDLIANFEGTMDECFDFLGVEHFDVKYVAENRSTAVHSAGLQWLLRTLDECRFKVARGLSSFRLTNFGLRRGVRPKKLCPKTRRKLLSMYQSDISSLEELLGKDLSFWLD